jgi:MscS family membrane protein
MESDKVTMNWSGIKEILHFSIFKNSLLQIAVALIIVSLFYLIRRKAGHFLLVAAKRAALKTKADIDDFYVETLKRPFEFFVVIIGINIAASVLTLPVKPVDIHLYAITAIRVAAIIAISWFFFKLTDAIADYLGRIWQNNNSGPDHRMWPILQISVKIVVSILAFVMIIQNMGYSISGLIAGLGIGGLAFALAAKDTLSNFFGAVVLFTDRPFIAGDVIKSGDVTGTVEQIGIRSTRIRTLDKTLISVPNSVLANSVVDNLSQRLKRRNSFTISIPGGISSELAAKAAEVIEVAVKSQDGVSAGEGVSARFTGFAAGAINISVQYNVETKDELEFLNIQQKVNLEILKKLEDIQVSLAGPCPAADTLKELPKSSKPAASKPFDFI